MNGAAHPSVVDGTNHMVSAGMRGRAWLLWGVGSAR